VSEEVTSPSSLEPHRIERIINETGNAPSLRNVGTAEWAKVVLRPLVRNLTL